MFLYVPLGQGDRVRTGCRIHRLVFSMFIVCMCTYLWWHCFWDGRECLYDVNFCFCFWSVFDWFGWCCLRLEFLLKCDSGYAREFFVVFRIQSNTYNRKLDSCWHVFAHHLQSRTPGFTGHEDVIKAAIIITSTWEADENMYIYTYVYIYICVYIYKYLYIYMYIYINIYMYTYTHICKYTCIYMYTCVFVQIHIHIHVYILPSIYT